MTGVARKADSIPIHDLDVRVEEALETLSAIRSGEVDALVVLVAGQQRVFVLKGSDHAHRVLYETLNEGAMMIAAEGTVLSANRRFAEMLGLPAGQILGAPLLRFIAPEYAARFGEMLGTAAMNGAKGELLLQRSDGGRVPALVSMRVVEESGDRFYTVVVTDLTELTEARAALERANDELEARVAARTEELLRANEALRAEIAERARLEEALRHTAEELREADRRKDEFLALLAHELRNPMAPILTAAELLRVVAQGQPQVERYRGVIDRQVRHMSRLVDDLLDVSRITRRTITLRKQPVDLSAAVQRAVEAARPLIDAAGHTITVTLPPEPLEIVVDPTRFEQVLVNLLNNAAKYTEQKGRIDLTVEAAESEVSLRVRDNGLGMPPELVPKVFDLFVQGERSLARSQGGLGIGLTMVRNLVELHGGRVSARSEGLGRGSEFEVRLPLVIASHRAPAASGDRTSDEGAPPVSLRVLVIEDNPDVARTLTDLLAHWGHEVRHAQTGEEGLRLAAEFVPQVVLVDIGLPGMSGYDVARGLRRALARAPDREAPLIVGLSGYGQERDKKHGVEAGFDHHLVKPPDPDALRRLVARRGAVAAA